MPPAPREWSLISCTIRFEPPDLLWTKFERATVPLEDAIRIVEICREMSDARPFILVAEMKELGRYEPEAGRYLSEHLPSEWFLGKIFIEARLIVRAHVKGVALASLLTEKPDPRAVEKLHYVSTVERAWEIIALLRAAHPR